MYNTIIQYFYRLYSIFKKLQVVFQFIFPLPVYKKSFRASYRAALYKLLF